jgi:hypothetical protein
MMQQPAAPRAWSRRMRTLQAFAEDFLQYGTPRESVRKLKRFRAPTPPPVLVQTLHSDFMALPLSVDLNNLHGTAEEQLLLTFVPTKSLRNPNHPANLLASIDAEFSHVELTIPRLALTITADVKSKCAHIRTHRSYKPYHRKIALTVTECELRCVHQAIMHMIGQRYGFQTILEARAKMRGTSTTAEARALQDDSALEGVVPARATPLSCLVGGLWSLFGSDRYVPIDNLEYDVVQPRSLMLEADAQECGEVRYLAPASSGVFGPDHEAACAPDSSRAAVDAVVFQRSAEQRAELMEQLLATGRESDTQRAQSMVFEDSLERNADDVREMCINYCRGFTPQMDARPKEIHQRLMHKKIVCSQVVALALYAIGVVPTFEQALACNAQDVYEVLQAPALQYRISECPDYEPPVSACVFSVRLPPNARD